MTSKYDRIPRGIARYGYGDWDSAFGNHRAVLRVAQASEAVLAYLPWRRRDAFPQAKHVWIVDGQTNQIVANSVTATCNREYGEVVFEPRSGPGLYYAYYLPPTQDQHRWEWPRWAFPITLYESAHCTADPGWRERCRVGQADLGCPPNPPGPFQNPACYPAPWRDLPEAELVEFQSLGEWNSFYPMEVIATLEEQMELFGRCGERPFLLFPESRDRPIRMNKDIPYHWAIRPTAELDRLPASACRNEYLVFQVGVFAHRALLPNLAASWTALEGPEGARLPAEALTCFNLEGCDPRGRRFVKTLHVPSREVQALWFGVDIPPDAAPGTYQGVLTIRAQDLPPQYIQLQIEVQEAVLADRGDGDGARLSRLRWLNSSHALDEEVCAPFLPVQVKGRTVTILGRKLEFAADGLPENLTSFINMFQIRPTGRAILAAPARLEAIKEQKPVPWTTVKAARCRRKSSGRAQFQALQAAPGLTRQTETTVEMDGRIHFRIRLAAEQDEQLEALRLVIELPAEVSKYWLEPAPPVWDTGVQARLGCNCPQAQEKALAGFQVAWVGDYNAGLALSLPGAGWPAGPGSCLRQTRAGGVCRLELESGPVQLAAGRPLTLEFALSVTPFKPLSTEHWNWRYCHQGYGRNLNLEEGLAAGATIFTQHQGSPNNPYISYLFPVAAELKALAERAHASGGRFKAYNTIRELSTRANELWTLRSLGYEILTPGAARLGFESLAQRPLEYQLRDLVNEPFVGQTWLCEHLVDDYHARWHSPIYDPAGKMIAEDSSLQISGASRWSNFYIEGLRWQMEQAGVDGLYLDGVTFDRASFLRVRKTLVRQKPQALIDLHGSPAEVMDFLGFVDSIWFGEGADYSREAAYWLTAVSGIPFGVPGELLQPEASVQRGMVYGLAQRYAWMPLDRVNPSALWQWWDSFDIHHAEMIGYWMDECPARADHPAVKATAYVHHGRRTAIALASWATEAVTVRLEIDWTALGLEAGKVRLSAPPIAFFQPALETVSLEALPVAPNGGWIVVIEAG